MKILFNIVTLFPELFHSYLAHGLIGKAIKSGIVQVELINFRKYGLGKHLSVDDVPYGGGAGMVLAPGPIVQALEEVDKKSATGTTYKILVTPQGSPFSQAKAKQLATMDRPVTLVCGKYEGFDERVHHFVDEEISIGDYILQGGEAAAIVIFEAVSRLIPGVIGNTKSLDKESFNDNLLEYDQYTRPAEFLGHKVPEILFSGNHKEIETWRKENSIEKTKKKRMDLYQRYKLLSS